MMLGYYPALSLAAAHQKHAAAQQEVQRGIDPGAAAKEEEAKRRAAETIKGLWLEFLEMELKDRPGTPTANA